MKTLLITHVQNEGPGTMGEFLEDNGVDLVRVSMELGEALPDNLEPYRAIISMGGPMNVYDEEEFPFLRKETSLLAKGIDMGLPVMGVCLGAQMIAKAAGAKVVKAPVEEIGWGRIGLTEEGARDILFKGMTAEEFDVFQWHGDTFEVPEAGYLLAWGEDCRNQAFRIKNAYGLQFHVEVTAEIISDWFHDSDMLQTMLHRYGAIEKQYVHRASLIYRNFLQFIKSFR